MNAVDNSLVAWRWQCGIDDGTSMWSYRLRGWDAGSSLTWHPIYTPEWCGGEVGCSFTRHQIWTSRLCWGEVGSSFIGWSGDTGSRFTQWRDGDGGSSLTRINERQRAHVIERTIRQYLDLTDEIFVRQSGLLEKLGLLRRCLVLHVTGGVDGLLLGRGAGHRGC